MTARLALVLAVCAAAVALLAASLRPDTFFVGDPGVKLVSARNALHSPAHPLDIPLPLIGPDPTPLIENFFARHDNHSHAVTSEWFPVASAPLLAAFGLRGLYILPALGFLGTLAAAAWLACVLDARREPALAAAAVALGTPFLFYGLEFWEHTPALALGVAGTAWLLDAAKRRPGRDAHVGAAFGAGLLCGLALVLRTEAVCFVAAVLGASRTLIHRPSWRTLTVAVAGIVVAMLPAEAYTVLHFGTLVPGHISTNANLIGGSWLAQRVLFAGGWLAPWPWHGAGPLRAFGFWGVAPAAIVAVASAFGRPARDERTFLWLVAGLTVLLVVLTAPNEGGGQWGPRYLLFAYVPLALLAADLLQDLPAGWPRTMTLVALLAACIVVQRAGYRQLRGTKETYGRLVDFVRAQTTAGTFVVTDVWWLDQLAAAALDGRTVLFTGDAETGRNVVQRLSDRTVPSLTVVRSREASEDVDSWSAPTCYFEEGREELPVRGVVAIRLRHRCGYKP